MNTRLLYVVGLILFVLIVLISSVAYATEGDMLFATLRNNSASITCDQSDSVEVKKINITIYDDGKTVYITCEKRINYFFPVIMSGE